MEGEKPVELQRLYVSTEWAGKGVGRLLVERVVELAKERGKRTLWLGVVSFFSSSLEVGLWDMLTVDFVVGGEFEGASCV